MTLSEKVYLNIKEDVNTLVFRTNEFLNEQQLAERYDVSKAPIRAALHRLCLEGILISYPRKGYIIVTLSDADFQQAQNMRVLNEGYAAELICANASQEQLEHLRQIAEEGESVRSNMDFHLALGQFSGNRFLLETIGRLLCAVTRTLNMYHFDSDKSTFQPLHIAIADALLERNAQKAKKLLQEDILR